MFFFLSSENEGARWAKGGNRIPESEMTLTTWSFYFGQNHSLYDEWLRQMTAAGCQQDGNGWAGCWAVHAVLMGFWIRVSTFELVAWLAWSGVL